jgi:hypothetical protein
MHELDYRRENRRGRLVLILLRALKALAFIILIITLSTASVVLWRRSMLLISQARCLVLASDQNQVAFASPAFANIANGAWIYRSRLCVIPYICWCPPSWDAFRQKCTGPQGPQIWSSRMMVFIHERDSKTGRRFLITVEARPHFTDDGAVFLTCNTYTIASWNTESALISTTEIKIAPAGSSGLLVYVGQPQGNDSSRFIVRTDFKGRLSSIEGNVDDLGNPSLKVSQP